MALKDLIASKASLAEEVIERIVADYVRFDMDHVEIAFTPAASELSNKSRVLIYLVALQGWPFVSDEAVPVDARPAEIEQYTGVSGGSLRPLLKELKDRKIIAEKGGRYFVRAVALHAIQQELDGKRGETVSHPKRKASKKSSNASDAKGAKTDGRGNARKTGRSSSAFSVGERLQIWIDSGYFDAQRTLAEIQQRFHKEAIIIPQTSLPKYLLKCIRTRKLIRERADVNGKMVWVYEKEKS